jgi:MFS family permease
MTRIGARFGVLWHAGSPNFRALALTGMLWTIPLSFTEPYRFLFCHRLGLSERALGFLVSADLILRALGLLLSGWTMRRFGAKRVLIVADLLSWVTPYTLFATATGPGQAGLALVLMSLNAFASTPYLCLLADGTQSTSRSRAFAFLALCNMLPTALLPWIAADLAETHDFLSVLRLFLGAQAVLMFTGIMLRARILESLPSRPTSAPGLALVLQCLWRSPAFRRIWPLLLLQGTQLACWNAWSAIWITGPLGLPDRTPGWLSQTTAISLVATTLLVLPRIPEHRIPHATAFVMVAWFGSSLLFLLPLPLPALLLIGSIQGAAMGIQSSAISSLLAAALPKRLRDHGFALSYVGVHLGVALVMAGGGVLLRGAPERLPWILVGIAALQALAGSRLAGSDERSASVIR